MKIVLKKIKNMPVSLKSALMYTICILFSRGLSIITIPIFTRLMSTEQIGVVSLFNSWNAIITIFTTLSLTSGGFSIAMKDFGDKREEYISSILFLTTILSFIVLIIYILMPSFWANLTGLSNKLLIIMLIGFFLSPAREFWLAHQRYEYKYVKSSLIIISSALLSSIISIIVVYFIKDNQAYYRILSTCTITYFVALILYVYIFYKGKKFISIKYWKYSLFLSLPLVGHSLASQVLSASDRIMISKIIDNNALGIYGTIYTISSISTMVWSAINASYVPFLYQNIGKKNKSIKSTSFILLLLYSLIAIICILFAPEIVMLITTPKYYEAIYIMPPIAAGVYFISISNMYSNILIYLKKTKYIMYSSIVAALLNLLLNYIFINKYGYIAAAYTTLVSYIIMSCLLYCIAISIFNKNSEYKLSEVYNNKAIILLSIITVIMAFVGLALYMSTIVRYIVITIIVLFTIIIYLKKKDLIMNIKTNKVVVRK